MLTYLEPFKNRFKSMDLDEVLTLLLLHLRHGDSFNYLHASVNRVRSSRPVKLETISKCIRKALLILSGPNPYLKETQELFLKNKKTGERNSDQPVNKHAENQRNAQNCYYAGSSFDGLREGVDIGKFFNSNVGWFAHDMDASLDEGTSWFDRCMQQSRLYLADQVERLEGESSEAKGSKRFTFKDPRNYFSQ